jgi:hypothetical protein
MEPNRHYLFDLSRGCQGKNGRVVKIVTKTDALDEKAGPGHPKKRVFYRISPFLPACRADKVTPRLFP